MRCLRCEDMKFSCSGVRMREDSFLFIYFRGDILAFMLGKSEIRSFDVSGSADNTCRDCCSALVLLPSLFSVDMADWVSSPCCRLRQSTLLGEARPGQALESWCSASRQPRAFMVPMLTMRVLREVLNECKNTQIHKAENECDLNARPPVLQAGLRNNAGGRCLLSSSLIKSSSPVLSTGPQSWERTGKGLEVGWN